MESKQLKQKLVAAIHTFIAIAQEHKTTFINYELVDPIKVLRKVGIGKGAEEVYEAFICAELIEEKKVGLGDQQHFVLRLEALLPTDASSSASKILDLLNPKDIRRYRRPPLPKSEAIRTVVKARKVPPFLNVLYYLTTRGIRKGFATDLHIRREDGSVLVTYDFEDAKDVSFVGTTVEELLQSLKNSAI